MIAVLKLEAPPSLIAANSLPDAEFKDDVCHAAAQYTFGGVPDPGFDTALTTTLVDGEKTTDPSTVLLVDVKSVANATGAVIAMLAITMNIINMLFFILNYPLSWNK